jgi:hypothetical protein
MTATDFLKEIQHAFPFKTVGDNGAVLQIGMLDEGCNEGWKVTSKGRFSAGKGYVFQVWQAFSELSDLGNAKVIIFL